MTLGWRGALGILLSVALPAAPGFFGLFESTGRFGLGLYGVRPTEAVSWAIGFHIVSCIPITVMGAWYLTRLTLHFRDFGGGGTGRAA